MIQLMWAKNVCVQLGIETPCPADRECVGCIIILYSLNTIDISCGIELRAHNE